MPPSTRDETAIDGGGLLQEASWGFYSEANRSVQPFLSFFHSLRWQTFDQSTMTRVFPHYTVHPDEKRKGDRDEDDEENRKEGRTI